MMKICYYGCEAPSLCQNGMCEACCGDTCRYHANELAARADYLKKRAREDGN
jgi:hypothetical protein